MSAWWTRRATRADIINELRNEANKYAAEALRQRQVMEQLSPGIPEQRPAHVTADNWRRCAEQRAELLTSAALLLERPE